jgi:peptidoglycan/xylan/chitin deacetylase (PgdA/CDA1 family)
MLGRVSLTFDDALESVYTLAMPEMEKRGMTATVFVIADLIGKSYGGISVMNERMLRSLSAKGWEIGSHTLTHPNLMGLSDSEVVTELRNSKSRLQSITSTKVTSFAYPFGAYDRRIKSLVARQYGSARSVAAYPPLRINDLRPRDMYNLKAMSSYEHAFTLPLHLIDNFHRRIRHSLRTSNSREFVTHRRKALDARLVGRWIKNLSNRQWLILCFHDLSSGEPSTPDSISRKAFCEIIDVIDKRADVANVCDGG